MFMGDCNWSWVGKNISGENGCMWRYCGQHGSRSQSSSSSANNFHPQMWWMAMIALSWKPRWMECKHCSVQHCHNKCVFHCSSLSLQYHLNTKHVAASMSTWVNKNVNGPTIKGYNEFDYFSNCLTTLNTHEYTHTYKQDISVLLKIREKTGLKRNQV